MAPEKLELILQPYINDMASACFKANKITLLRNKSYQICSKLWEKVLHS